MAIESLAVRREKKKAIKAKRSIARVNGADEKSIQAQKIKIARDVMIGFTLEWSDRLPLADGKEDESTLLVTSSNSNPVMRSGAKETWSNLKIRNWVCLEVFTWQATITIVHDLPNNKGSSERHDVYEIRHTAPLKCRTPDDETKMSICIDNFIMAELLSNTFYKDGDKNKGVFNHVKYKIQCVGV